MNELDMLVYDGHQVTSPVHRTNGSGISPTLGSSNSNAMLLASTLKPKPRSVPVNDDTLFPATRGGKVRRLTPLECERLMGFPDGYTTGQSDTQRYKQLGNAVGVPIVEWIAQRIVEVENGTKL